MSTPFEGVGTVLADEVEALRGIVRGLNDNELILASGCHGWRVADLVVHLRLGAEAILVGLAASTEDPADRDFISYWRDWPAHGPAGFSEVRFTWAIAAAYSTAEGLRRHFDDVAEGVSRAARVAPPGRVHFQGHVLEVEDLLATWVVEFALHHLDLIANLSNRPIPGPDALELTAVTLDGLLGAPRPPWWDVVTYVQKATGRRSLENEERSVLGPVAERYPAFG